MAIDFLPEELALLNQGDPTISSRVYFAYQDELCAFIMRYIKKQWLAQELTGETLYLFLSRTKEIKDNTHLRNRLYKIAKHRIANHYRSHKNSPFIDISDPPDYVPDHQNPDPLEIIDSKATTEYMQAAIAAAIKDMSDDHKKIFEHYLADKRPAEIAEIMNMEARKVSDCIYYIKKKVKPILERFRKNRMISYFLVLFNNFL